MKFERTTHKSHSVGSTLLWLIGVPLPMVIILYTLIH